MSSSSGMTAPASLAARKVQCIMTIVLFTFNLFVFGLFSSAFALSGLRPIRIAVFPFHLVDFSAAGEKVPTSREKIYLSEAADEAMHQLTRSGEYIPVVVTGTDITTLEAEGFPGCLNCIPSTAVRLGASQALTGTVTRISRTEYTVEIRIVDAVTGLPVSTARSDLRVGADYSWSRGVRTLLQNRLVADK